MVDQVDAGLNLQGGGNLPLVVLDFDPAKDNFNLAGTPTCPTPPVPGLAGSSRIVNATWVNQILTLRDYATREFVEQAILEAEFPDADLTNLWNTINEHIETRVEEIGAIAHVGNAPPDAPLVGRLWLRELDARLYARYPQPTGAVWIEIGAGGVGGGGGGSGGDGILEIFTGQASGTNYNEASTVNAGFTEITHGTGGVRWSVPQAGRQCFVRNATLDTIAFYPPTGGTINDETANKALYIPPNATGHFVAMSATRLASVP